MVRFDDGDRSLLLWLQGAALFFVIVLALPSARTVEDVDEMPVAAEAVVRDAAVAAR